ncbi:hypothetical protein [Streptodolium elevatio]
MHAQQDGPDQEAASEPATRVRLGLRRRRYLVSAAAASVLALLGTALAFAAFHDGRGSGESSGPTMPSPDPRRGPALDPVFDPAVGPIGPRVELDCPAPLTSDPVPAPLDPRATAGNAHTLATGAVAARLCEPPEPFRTGGPPVATRVGPMPTTLYHDVDRVVRKVNSYAEADRYSLPPHTFCPLDARAWLTLELLYPGGIRVSVPMNLGGCGEARFSDTTRQGARGFDTHMTALLEEQRMADPPMPAPAAPVCEESRPAGRVPLRRESLGLHRDVVPYAAAHLVACRYSAGPDGDWTLRGTDDLGPQREEIRALVNAAVPEQDIQPWPDSVPCDYPREGFTLLGFADAAGARYEVLVVGGPCAHMYLELRSATYGGEQGAPVPADLLRRLGL